MPPVSKIAKLPADIRRALEQVFVQSAFGDIEGITAWLNEQLAAQGLSMTIGKSAVGREALRLKQAQEAIAASTRAMQLVAESARDDADLRGEALNAALGTGLFESLLQYQEAAAEENPVERIKLYTKASLGSARLTLSSVKQRQWRKQVEEQAKAAADAVTKIAREGGLSPERERAIREQILGIPKRVQAAAPAAAEA